MSRGGRSLAAAPSPAIALSAARAPQSRSTRFFDDAGALNALAAHVLPSLVNRATAEFPVRVWVPECGTGDEAYSVAMLLLERLEAAGKNAALKVFATDADPESLIAARLGIYPESIAEAVSPERLARFFDPVTARRYQVSSELRRTVVFGRLDPFTDPPIANLDLLVCRAQFRDFGPGGHAGLISRLHFALKPSGYLLLGPAAPEVAACGLFESLSEQCSLYRKDRPATPAVTEEHEKSQRVLQEITAAGERVEAQLRAVLDATADAVVTINAEGKIITFNGSASRMFGYALHEVIGRNANMLLPPELRALHDEYLARYRRTHQRHVIGTSREVVAYRRDGTRFPALLAVSETTDADLLVGCLRDLTGEKALQEEVLHIAALEQQRIGQELHDGTQQELTGLGLLAQNLSEALQERGSAKELAKRLAAGIGEANRHVRALARGLVSVPVDAETLPAALDALARNTQETYKLSCRVDCPTPLRMPDAATATHLYRIAQEAVGNAAKHAKADNVLIRLASDDNRLRMEIHDDGIGIPARPVVNGGMGLRLMEHRCTAIGGRFMIEPGACGGTVVSCTVPFLGRS